MTIRAGFLSGGMRRAEMLDVPNKDIMFCGSPNAAYTALELASRRTVTAFLPAFFRSTAGIIGGIYDYNKKVRRLLTYSSKGFIQMMDVDRWAFVADVIANPTGMACIRFSNSGQYFALCSSGSGVRIYDTLSFKEIKTVFTDKTPRHACWSQSDRYLAVALLETPYVRVYDTTTWAALANPAVLPTGQGNSVSFSRGGDYVAVGHNNTPFFSEYRLPSLTKISNPANLPNGNVIHIRYSPIRNILLPVTVEADGPWYSYEDSGAEALVWVGYVPVGTNAHYLEYDNRGLIAHSDDDGVDTILGIATDYLNVFYYYNKVMWLTSVSAMRATFSNHALGI